jgi:osmotically-inducible protein OsmY
MDDEVIRRAVVEELEWAPHVDASDIAVAVHDGIVRLTGHVRSLVEKRAAERAVWHVQGVRGIAEELVVQRPAAHLYPDEEVARRAADILRWDVQIPGSEIKVRVEQGVLTLIGAVDWQFQRVEAEELVRHLAGVVAVDNQIVVRPRAAPVAETREKVLRALERHVELDHSAIRVDVQDGRVTLTGSVPSLGQRHIAENAAWSAPGVSDVLNLLQVQRATVATPA